MQLLLSYRLERAVKDEITIKGVTIPKGIQVGIPVAALHMNPDYWPEPDKFDPDRLVSPDNFDVCATIIRLLCLLSSLSPVGVDL